MTLIIRLRQQGARNEKKYRLVLTEKRAPRDGKYLEKLGWYNPHAKEDQELFVQSERVLYWLSHGAMMSEKAKSLVKRFAPDVIKKLSENKQKKKKA